MKRELPVKYLKEGTDLLLGYQSEIIFEVFCFIVVGTLIC